MTRLTGIGVKNMSRIWDMPMTRLVTTMLVKVCGSCTWDMSHDEPGYFYTCQNIIVMYTRHAYNKAGNCPTCAHAYRMCYAHGHNKSWQLPYVRMGLCISGHAHNEAVCSQPGTVSIKSQHTFCSPPVVHKAPSPHCVKGAHKYLYWVSRLTLQISEQVPTEKNKHKGDPARAGQSQEQTLGCSTLLSAS